MIEELYYRIIEKLFNIFNITKIYENKVGIKMINSQLKNQKQYIINEIKLDKEDLYLGFDALKDSYTLCGVAIKDSPHYNFINTIKNGENIKSTDYYIRYSKGVLDGRKKKNIHNKDIKKFYEFYNIRKKEIENEIYKPIQVYKINDKYYIADGKHRAAFCAVMNKKIKCYEITDDFLKDSTRIWIYNKMCKNKELYSKNIRLFQDINT